MASATSLLGKALTNGCELPRVSSVITINSAGEASVVDTFRADDDSLATGDGTSLVLGGLPTSMDTRSVTLDLDMNHARVVSHHIIESLYGSSDNFLRVHQGLQCRVTTRKHTFEGVLVQHTADMVLLRQKDGMLCQIERSNIEGLAVVELPKADVVERAMNNQMLVKLDGPIHLAMAYDSFALTYQCRGFSFVASHTWVLNTTHDALSIICAVDVTNNTGVDYPEAMLCFLERKMDQGRAVAIKPQYEAPRAYSKRAQMSSASRSPPSDNDYDSERASAAAPSMAAIPEALSASGEETQNGGRLIKMPVAVSFPRNQVTSCTLGRFAEIECRLRWISRSSRPMQTDYQAEATTRLLEVSSESMEWMSFADQRDQRPAGKVMLPSGMVSVLHKVPIMSVLRNTVNQPLFDSALERYPWNAWAEGKLVRLVMGTTKTVSVKRRVESSDTTTNKYYTVTKMRVEILNSANYKARVKLEELMPQRYDRDALERELKAKALADKVTTPVDSRTLAVTGVFYSVPDLSSVLSDYCDAPLKSKFFEASTKFDQFEVAPEADLLDKQFNNNLFALELEVAPAHMKTPSVAVVCYTVITPNFSVRENSY